ncbi:MAG: TrkH family potassium uptake protein [Candidatus Thermoplasmatota archaeon]|nr:TrkH family potassium uptake protein [Euryarchaeota archaeon]MBU4031350.1 TrkH family potassium uptake protein [Candidatus Thermoplasmatota archaeon]MBU4071402.1 TrkH family potassium uptake protein [Candidatus Thermoplasmatota archaeon]MBU4143506.1 TrkH family potassium uptake protein [Candidatus Thermoplasmatota archaeon]MBU4591740.1 TrkH family potassium uptake protein [Candidatus Thermoplasmatota archaeon]
MRYREVGATLGYLLMIFSASFILPMIVGAYYNEGALYIYKAYVIPFLICASTGCIMWYHSRNRVRNLKEGDAYVVVGLGWLIIAFFGALPYITGGTITNPIDAYFESMSGFTTTGASVIDPAIGNYLDVYPHSILFWRALTNWLGGLGIIVLGAVILARFMHGGVYLFKAEMASTSVTRLRPKLYQTARILWGVYGLLTALCIIFYMGAGMSLYHAVCIAMPTLASGGFSLHGDSIGFYASPAVEIVAIVFMFLSGVNFVLHYRFITGRFKDALNDPELKFFFVWVIFMTSLVILGLALSGTMGVSGILRDGAFQAVSCATNTGFTTQNGLALWPPFVHLILIFLMLTGGMVGSTCGGLKMSRVMILLKNLRNGMIKAIHPRAVLSVKIGGKAVPETVVARIQILLLIFIMLFGISVLLLCASGIGIVDSISAVASCMTNTGVGIFNPEYGFHLMNPFARIVLTVCMWMGRLEIFTALIVLAPSTYKR